MGSLIVLYYNYVQLDLLNGCSERSSYMTLVQKNYLAAG